MMNEERSQPTAEAIGWLMEMEIVNNPAFLNSIILNLFRLSKTVVDVDFVVDHNSKKLLVYLELTRWGKWLFQRKIANSAKNMLDEALPTYKKRVIFDKTILDKALNMIRG